MSAVLAILLGCAVGSVLPGIVDLILFPAIFIGSIVLFT